jgi:DNA-binding XRE family transcriptional regulator
MERGYRRAHRPGWCRMMPPDREPAGQRIARARRRRGLSQAMLAGLVGRSESWLSQVERGSAASTVTASWCACGGPAGGHEGAHRLCGPG